MGIANAQRTLNYIRTLTEFISTDQYKNVVPHFSILNEPYSATIGVDTLRHLYVDECAGWARVGTVNTLTGILAVILRCTTWYEVSRAMAKAMVSQALHVG